MSNSQQRTSPEVWGGMECTINRVADEYHDQYERTGQYDQQDDLKKVAQLGFSKLRFPILWERHHNNPAAWEYTHQQLAILAQQDVIPIAGLLHHGGGPDFTDLTDPAFPELFAAYALQVATAFPQIEYYTPVNEPLTTARFSGLYGFWYPHGKDDYTFALVFLNQLKGTVLSMQAIRTINPKAQLVQTEDLCKVYSTKALRYQARFENERRWWTYDFLLSKVDRLHPAWNFFSALGIPVADLQFFLDNPCPPSIAGFNYHVTSERYLDNNIEDYPAELTGGNGRDNYVDTEAVRTGHAIGLKPLLSEAWSRFGLPMALTECHLTCTREQQLRWLQQQWEVVRALNEAEIPVIALTVWALVGGYDWDTLVTEKHDHYDSGVFIIEDKQTKKTALTAAVQVICNGEIYSHPALPEKGWWEVTQNSPGRPVIAIGDQSFVGQCTERFLTVVYAEDANGLYELIIEHKAWGIIATDEHPTLKGICYDTQTPIVIISEISQQSIDEGLDRLIDLYAEDIYAEIIEPTLLI